MTKGGGGATRRTREGSTRASKTHLMAYDAKWNVVLTSYVSSATYAEHVVFHDQAFRKDRKVYAVIARVHDDKARLVEERAWIYDAKGKLLGGTGIATKDISFDTIAKAQKTLKLRPRGHQGLGPQHRKALVKLVMAEKEKTGRLIAEILKEIGIPPSTYTKWAMASGLLKTRLTPRRLLPGEAPSPF